MFDDFIDRFIVNSYKIGSKHIVNSILNQPISGTLVVNDTSYSLMFSINSNMNALIDIFNNEFELEVENIKDSNIFFKLKDAPLDCKASILGLIDVSSYEDEENTDITYIEFKFEYIIFGKYIYNQNSLIKEVKGYLDHDHKIIEEWIINEENEEYYGASFNDVYSEFQTEHIQHISIFPESKYEKNNSKKLLFIYTKNKNKSILEVCQSNMHIAKILSIFYSELITIYKFNGWTGDDYVTIIPIHKVINNSLMSNYNVNSYKLLKQVNNINDLRKTYSIYNPSLKNIAPHIAKIRNLDELNNNFLNKIFDIYFIHYDVSQRFLVATTILEQLFKC